MLTPPLLLRAQVITCPFHHISDQSPAFVWDVASDLKSKTRLVVDGREESYFDCPVVASPDGKYIYASGWARQKRTVFRWEL